MSFTIPEIETRSPHEIKLFQEKKFKEFLRYVNANSTYYKRLFKANLIDPESINTIEQLQQIPVTTKDDLVNFNQDFICVPTGNIIDYVTTSGTTGEPVTIALTNNDLDRLAYNEAISLTCAGLSRNDIIHLMTSLDRRFMAGLAYFMGIRKIGAGIVRSGNGMPEFQWDTIKRLNPTVAIAVPSFILKMMEFAEKNNIDHNNSSIKKIICIGEPIRNKDFSLNTLGTRITEKWNIQLFSTYASTEMGAAFTECSEGKGGHSHPELLIVELLDTNDKPVQPGEPGEVTVTTLGVEGLPLLRFKTGDICVAYHEPCSCGRRTMRLGPIIGRKQQMIKYKGTTLYPSAFYEVLNATTNIKNYIVEVSDNAIGTDDICIKIGMNDPSERFELELKERFRAKLRVTPSIQFEEPETIAKLQFPEMSRKAITFIDRRKK